jgi:hypothetical protein
VAEGGVNTLNAVRRNVAYGATVNLVVVECHKCAVPFGMPDSLNDECLKDHRRSFFCPNGHEAVYTGETDAERLKRQLRYANERATEIQANLDRTEASRRAWKGQTTKLRNRAAEGQCPFCGKFRVDLAIHMSKQHPDEKPRELTEDDAAGPA